MNKLLSLLKNTQILDRFKMQIKKFLGVSEDHEAFSDHADVMSDDEEGNITIEVN